MTRSARLSHRAAAGAGATGRFLRRSWARLLAPAVAVAGAAGLGGVGAWLLHRWLDFDLGDLVPGASPLGFADLFRLNGEAAGPSTGDLRTTSEVRGAADVAPAHC